MVQQVKVIYLVQHQSMVTQLFRGKECDLNSDIQAILFLNNSDFMHVYYHTLLKMKGCFVCLTCF